MENKEPIMTARQLIEQRIKLRVKLEDWPSEAFESYAYGDGLIAIVEEHCPELIPLIDYLKVHDTQGAVELNDMFTSLIDYEWTLARERIIINERSELKNNRDRFWKISNMVRDLTSNQLNAVIELLEHFKTCNKNAKVVDYDLVDLDGKGTAVMETAYNWFDEPISTIVSQIIAGPQNFIVHNRYNIVMK